MSRHEAYMNRALEIAKSSLGNTSPNPMVGALIVVGDHIIAEGNHQRAGEAHAEVNAIAAVPPGQSLTDATLYVTLEPCAHHGRTPPCAEAILSAGIKTVVISAPDVNPITAGRGIALLRSAGISVTERVLLEESVLLNRRYYTNQLCKRPYVILKWAETSDGYIARTDGTSKWISSESARTEVHRMRSLEDGILVGRKTALIDNPALTVRHVSGRNPVRVVLDRKLSLPETSQIFSADARTMILNECQTSTEGSNEFLKLDLSTNNPGSFLPTLYQQGICSLIVEGGAQTLQSFIDSNLWDEAFVFVGAPRFTAGISAPHISESRELKGTFEDTELFFIKNHSQKLSQQVRDSHISHPSSQE